jgi:type IV secretion system protein VirB10
LVDRIAAPEFIDDPRPAIDRYRTWPLVAGGVLLVGAAFGIPYWLTSGPTEPPPRRAANDQSAAVAAPLPGLPTDYTQIKRPPAPATPPAEKPKEDPASAAPEPRIVYQQGASGGGGGKSWRQEARETDAKVVEVTRPGGGATMDRGGGVSGGGRGQMYSSAGFTEPFPMQVNARTPIRAHTEQPITTDSPGYVSALVTHDVLTSDKKCVAIPFGSRLYGETIGEVKEGQVRVTTVWTALQRPEPRNDTIELTKVVGGEADGTAGLPGSVNNHWLRKFGFIIASSAIDLGVAALQGRGGGGFAVVLGDTVAQNARSPLDEFAKKQLDIPPTIEVEPREVSVTISQHIPVDCFDQR